MERPAVFMISITVLYTLALSLLSHLTILPSQNHEIFSNKKFENLTSKVYHIPIPVQAQSTGFKSLQGLSTDFSMLSEKSFDFTVKSLEFSVLTLGSVYFELINQNFFYTPVQVLLVESANQTSLACRVFNDRGLVPPEDNLRLGPLVCESSRNGRYEVKVLLVHDGKVLERFRVDVEVKGPVLEMNAAEECKGEKLQKFQIKNVGDSSVRIFRTFFWGFSCFEGNLEIFDCNRGVELGKDERFEVVITGFRDFSQVYISSLLYVDTSYGIFSLPFTSTLEQESDDSGSGVITWLVAFLSLYLSIKSSAKCNIVSSHEQISSFQSLTGDLHHYSKPVMRDNSKTYPSRIQIIKHCQISDQFTMTSETTDTHLNSPTISSKSEDLHEEEDYFLDSYKITGLFSMNLKSSFNSL